MLALGFWGSLVSIALIAVSLLLVGLVLLQKNKGSGLSGAFGGVGGHSAFGTKTGDFLTWVTVGLATVFLLLNIAGNYLFDDSATRKKQTSADVADTSPDDTDAGTNTPTDGNTGAVPGSGGSAPGKN